MMDIMPSLGPQEVMVLFAEFDTNGNGVIDYKELTTSDFFSKFVSNLFASPDLLFSGFHTTESKHETIIDVRSLIQSTDEMDSKAQEVLDDGNFASLEDQTRVISEQKDLLDRLNQYVKFVFVSHIYSSGENTSTVGQPSEEQLKAAMAELEVLREENGLLRSELSETTTHLHEIEEEYHKEVELLQKTNEHLNSHVTTLDSMTSPTSPNVVVCYVDFEQIKCFKIRPLCMNLKSKCLPKGKLCSHLLRL